MRTRIAIIVLALAATALGKPIRTDLPGIMSDGNSQYTPTFGVNHKPFLPPLSQAQIRRYWHQAGWDHPPKPHSALVHRAASTPDGRPAAV